MISVSGELTAGQVYIIDKACSCHGSPIRSLGNMPLMQQSIKTMLKSTPSARFLITPSRKPKQGTLTWINVDIITSMKTSSFEAPYRLEVFLGLIRSYQASCRNGLLIKFQSAPVSSTLSTVSSSFDQTQSDMQVRYIEWREKEAISCGSSSKKTSTSNVIYNESTQILLGMFWRPLATSFMFYRTSASVEVWFPGTAVVSQIVLCATTTISSVLSRWSEGLSKFAKGPVYISFSSIVSAGLENLAYLAVWTVAPHWGLPWRSPNDSSPVTAVPGFLFLVIERAFTVAARLIRTAGQNIL